MENKILNVFKDSWKRELLISIVLWLMVFAGYNANFWRILSPDFPTNLLDFFHGIRTFFPILAGILAIIFLFIKTPSLPEGFFLTPLGLLSLYVIFGVISSVFSKEPLWALYWALMYGAVIVVLWLFYINKNSLKKIHSVININWLIAGILAIGLFVFFLIQPGVIGSLNFNFLICQARPYEGFAGVKAEIDTFGMPGTRPTGWARYAGVMAVIAFCSFLFNGKRKKVVWFLLFTIFLFILLFSKGKTEIIGFIVAMSFVLVMSKKINPLIILGLVFIIIISIFIIFFNIPCINKSTDTHPTDTHPTDTQKIIEVGPTISGENQVFKNIPSQIVSPKMEFNRDIINLSGRISGVWQDAWHLFFSNPLIGYGFQADRYFLQGQHAHNTILHALIQTGLLGTIPLVLAFVFVFLILLRLFKNPNMPEKERYFLTVTTTVLVFFVVRGTTESLAFYSADWLFVAPIIAYIQFLYFNGTKKQQS